MMGIYQIINKVNQYSYIGLSNNIERRIAEHFTPKNIKNKNFVLYRAIRKYGKDNFYYIVLCQCETPEELFEKEMYFIEKLKPRYNMNNGGTGNGGRHVSDSVKKILSEKGRIQWDKKTDKEKKLIIINNLKGPKEKIKLTDAQKQHLSQLNLGKKHSAETKLKIGLANKSAMIGNKSGNKPIIMTDLSGNIVMEFESTRIAANHVGVTPSCITSVLKGRRKTVKGFKWEYKININN